MTWQYFVNQWAMPFRGLSEGSLGFLVVSFFIVLAWSLVWKGLALWRAAQRGDRGWFVVFLLINTLGILEVLYLYVFSMKEKKEDNSIM